MIRRVEDFFSDHDDVMCDALFSAEPHLSDDAMVSDAHIKAVPMVTHSRPTDGLFVVALTHTARRVTMQVEPILAVLYQTQRRQDKVQALVWNLDGAGPTIFGLVEVTSMRLDLAVVVVEPLDVHREVLTLHVHRHDRPTVIRVKVVGQVEA